MDAILDFLKGIAESIGIWFDNFVLRMTAERTVLGLILDFRSNLDEYLAWIPDQVYQIIYVGFSISLLYILIGRN